MEIGLRSDVYGWLVTLLHDVLASSGFLVEEMEVTAQRFGASTSAALRDFQESHNLAVTGEVDSVTLAALLQVRLGVASITAQHSGRRADMAHDSGMLGYPANEHSSTTAIVMGTVTASDRPVIGALRIQIVDRNVGRDIPLAEARTDAQGRYQVQFTVPSARRMRKDKLDLQARAYAGDVLLATSPVRYDASETETLDITLPPGTSLLPSEYESLTAALATQYDGPLGDLQEDGERQDITYLANKAGWDARAIAFAALADQLSRSSPAGDATIDPAFYYALLRAGLPADAESLHQIDADIADRVFRDAIDQGVIPGAVAEALPGAVSAFQARSAAIALDVRSGAGVSTLRDMLRVPLADDPAKQQQFADLKVTYGADPARLWPAVREAFGDATASKLELQFQLGGLTLDNAPLLARLDEVEAKIPLSSAVDLAARGYHRPEAWIRLLDGDVPVPEAVPGDTAEARRATYAGLLAARVRLDYPTASVAEMVRSGTLPIAAGADVQDGVHSFLSAHQAGFDIGAHPIDSYLAKNALGEQVSAPVKEQIQRIQRAYQITPSDTAMIGLLGRDVHSAYQVVGHDEATFVERFQDDLGGEADARLTYAKARQVHGAVLNLGTSYLTARNAPALGASADAPILAPAPTGPATTAAAGTALAAGEGTPTLETLFGSMDHCACEDCRSVLSPAAYLVDLLFFLDVPGADPDPAADARPPLNPLAVLRRRRPDIEQLPLTCENTNTPLPYIDLVNETLEYFVAHGQGTLDGYAGHDTGSLTPEELAAGPQFVENKAYQILAGAQFPPPLPFHLPLATLRGWLERLGLPLHALMEALRLSDAFDGAGGAYGVRDILLERLALSRKERELLTSTTSLWEAYGYPSDTTDEEVVKRLSSAKGFTRRIGISYEDLVAILRTRFVNPAGELLPMLEPLHASFATLADIKHEPFTPPTGLDLTPYGGDVVAWVTDPDRFARIMSLIRLTDPTNGENRCSFDGVELRYANPDNDHNRLSPVAFLRIARFIRLWKKLGWTIAQTDAAILALYPKAPDGATDLERLGNGIDTVLWRLGVALQVVDRLGLDPTSDLMDVLACWSPSADKAASSAWLARTLRLGARELDLLKKCTGLDPLVPPDPLRAPATGVDLGRTVQVDILIFVQLMQALRAASLEPTQVLYLIWDQDISGKSAPGNQEIEDLADALDKGIAAVDVAGATNDEIAARKRQQALVVISAAARVDAVIARTILTDALLDALIAKADRGNKAVLRDAHVRLLKLGSLATALKLTPNEVTHVCASWANKLPVSAAPDAATSQTLCSALLELLDFARLKAALAPGDERVLSVLRDPTSTASGGSLISTLTGWSDAAIDALLLRFYGSKNRAVLSRVPALRRVHGAASAMAKVIAKSDQLASALLAATTNDPDVERVQELTSALHASYDSNGFLDLARSINDDLRRRKRDALVARVLHERSGTDIDTPDKLFEHLLMDVQMEPGMETSRVRHALSSVQLFIEQCLMGIERDALPLSPDQARRWTWMKRYRVWQANREVFLWPENWLEPELRDDQSPIFKETMSELLQHDITEDAAATALLGYLTGLNNVAKLTPCGLHYVESDSGKENDVVHVVAHNADAHRRYYYRRCEAGTWTPWEQIKLDIEGDPVIPVVWNDRLLLLWLRMLKQPSIQQPPTTDHPSSQSTTDDKRGVGSITLSELKRDAAAAATDQAQVHVRAILCWSERYDGKWQTSQTSDLEQPADLGLHDATGAAFDRSLLSLGVVWSHDRRVLGVRASYGETAASIRFVLYNTHSALVVDGAPPDELLTSGGGLRRSFDPIPIRDSFDVHYSRPDPDPRVPGNDEERSLLSLDRTTRACLVEPVHPLADTWAAPFLFEDSRNVFYVTTTRRQVPIAEPPRILGRKWFDIPPLRVPVETGPVRPGPIADGIQRSVRAILAENPKIRTAIAAPFSVPYGGMRIGPSGALQGSLAGGQPADAIEIEIEEPT